MLNASGKTVSHVSSFEHRGDAQGDWRGESVFAFVCVRLAAPNLHTQTNI